VGPLKASARGVRVIGQPSTNDSNETINPNLHKFGADWLYVIVEKFRLQIINAQFQRTQALSKHTK